MQKMNTDLDDLDEILSNFPTEDDINNEDEDSADEILDMLMEQKNPVSPPKKKQKSEIENISTKKNETDAEDSDADEIAALEAKLKKLREKKLIKKSKSPKTEKPPQKENNDLPTKSPYKTIDQKSENENGNCKHNKPIEKCFFCSQLSGENDQSLLKSENKCKRNDTFTSEVKSIEKENLKENSQQELQSNGFYSKKNKERISHQSKSPTEKKVPKEPISINKTNVTKKTETNLKPKNIDGNGKSAYCYGGVDIKNPIVSSLVLEERMKGRRLVKISKIEATMKNNDIEGDWVTIGVLVKKVAQKTAVNGKNFSVWQLSDLGLGTENIVVGFFLFGEVNKEHWKTQAGAVIGLLNPTIMKKDKSENNISISIDNPRKLMEIGFSKDLGTCKGVRKSDNKACGMFINKKYGDYCEYHVQRAFRKAKSGRMELQSGGMIPKKKGKGSLMNNIKKDIQAGEIHYGGRTVTLSNNSGGPKNQVKLKTAPPPPSSSDKTGLRSVMGKDIKAMAAKEFQEIKVKREKDKLLEGGTDEFKELLGVPTIGARNLMRLLDGNRVKEEESVSPQPKVFSARSFLKTNKQELLPKTVNNNNNKTDVTKDQKKRKLCDTNFFDVSIEPKINKNTNSSNNISNKNVKQESSKDQLKTDPTPLKKSLKDILQTNKAPALGKGIPGKPMLGRGLRKSDEFEFDDTEFCWSYDKYTGEDVALTTERTGDEKALANTISSKQDRAKKKSMDTSKAKLKALSAIRQSGPISADDPNQVPGKKHQVDAKGKIEKRIDKCLQEPDDDTEAMNIDNKQKKKKGLLSSVMGDIDLGSEETKKLLKTKSKNVGAIKLADAEREEKYFNALEKKEMMEEKMNSVTEIKVTCYACRDCKYIAESSSTLCKTEGHKIVKVPNVSKRFFACKSCKNRCCSYNRMLPKDACSKCGETNFVKTSMAYERKGPRIGGETLELRGREQKFLNSMT